jgi:Trypsin-like peptidase domain
MDTERTSDQVSFWPGHWLSYTTTKVDTFFNDMPLGTATAFVMRFGEHIVLVTNWHVLSGFNAATGACLSEKGAIPNRIECHVAVSRKVEIDNTVVEQLLFKPIKIGLFSEDRPIWIDDRDGQSQNDYAIIDLLQFLPELNQRDVSLRYITGGRVTLRDGVAPPHSGPVRRDDVRSFYPAIGAEVFVLGYPRGVSITGIFPIWKRASIASEPQSSVTLGGTPHKNLFYIDSLTKSGMSGAPVVCLAKPGDVFYTDEGRPVLIKEPAPFLIGIYAGRDGVTQEEYELSLGRVWKIGAVEALFYTDRDKEIEYIER